MYYDDVLAFTQKLLICNHISTHIIEAPFDSLNTIDHGLRESLFEKYDYVENYRLFISSDCDNTLFLYTDKYYCSYAFFKLPNPKKEQFFIVGPFTYIKFTGKNYGELLSQLDVPINLYALLKKYYYNIPYIDYEDFFKSILLTLADALWGDSDNYSVKQLHGSLNNKFNNEFYISDIEKEPYLSPVNIEFVEERYRFEEKCMQTVRLGNLSNVERIMSEMQGYQPVKRLDNTLRDKKNYLIVFNTILRKAAEEGAVHPVYLDEISSKFAKKIEDMTCIKGNEMEREMLHKYCLLVHNHSLKGYSPIIKKVLNQINLNLCSDLSLKNLSEMFNISAGYLSTLFKKELGLTLTEYINSKRIEYALLLLNTTNMQIQNIASACGITDVNYFTKIFKKQCKMTPTKYKELVTK